MSFVTGDEATEAGGFDSADRARLKDRLLYLGAELESIVAFADGRYDPDPDGPARWLREVSSPLPEESSREALQRWRHVFADELQTVRLARNSVAHAKYISDGSLRNAIAIGDRLVSIAKSSMGENYRAD